MTWDEIEWSALDGVQCGHAQDEEAKTGVTALVFPDGATAGVWITGGGPASRETPVLSPTTAATPVHALVLGGGSAYGLAASDGVMRTLEAEGIGYPTGFALVPIVVQSDIYDLAYGSPFIRPDAAMGAEATKAALAGTPFGEGNVGAGIGAAVGKGYGMARAMKGGVGLYAVRLGELTMGAFVVLNAWGDIYDHETGQKIAGALDEDRKEFVDVREALYGLTKPHDLFDRTNTTIGAIITNGDFTKSELTRLAAAATNGYGRSIKPVGTLADGDTIYGVSAGKRVTADLNMACALSAEVMGTAIRRAVKASAIPDEEFLRHVGTPM